MQDGVSLVFTNFFLYDNSFGGHSLLGRMSRPEWGEFKKRFQRPGNNSFVAKPWFWGE